MHFRSSPSPFLVLVSTLIEEEYFLRGPRGDPRSHRICEWCRLPSEIAAGWSPCFSLVNDIFYHIRMTHWFSIFSNMCCSSACKLSCKLRPITDQQIVPDLWKMRHWQGQSNEKTTVTDCRLKIAISVQNSFSVPCLQYWFWILWRH